MVRQTSLRAYLDLSRILPQRERQVYDVIKMAPDGVTNNEIAHYLKLPHHYITGRTNKLVKDYMVKEINRRKDLYTGNTCIAWSIHLSCGARGKNECV